jgi:hypothetical protein
MLGDLSKLLIGDTVWKWNHVGNVIFLHAVFCGEAFWLSCNKKNNASIYIFLPSMTEV